MVEYVTGVKVGRVISEIQIFYEKLHLPPLSTKAANGIPMQLLAVVVVVAVYK